MGQRVRFVVVGIPPPGGVSMLSGKLKLGGIEEEERKASTAVAPGGPAERHQERAENRKRKGRRQSSLVIRSHSLKKPCLYFFHSPPFPPFLRTKSRERAKEVYSQGYIHCMP